jgi:hypothetical protein
MNRFSRRKLAIGATALALFGGTAAAVAATQSSPAAGPRAYVDDLAKRLGVAPSALTAAMQGARADRIDAALAAGRITKAQADALKAHIRGATRLARGKHLGARRLAAQYLGITPAELRKQLRSGRSLAQIAASTSGKSVDGLRAALTAAATTRLQKALADGSITSQQEQKRLGAVSRRIDALLNRSPRAAAAAAARAGTRGH